MKILFLTPQLPYPPNQGTTIRNYNLLKGLAANHELHLLSFGVSEELTASPLRELCQRIEIVSPPSRSFLTRAIETFISSAPDMARRLHSPVLLQKLGEMLSAASYDAVQIEGIEMAYCLTAVRRPPSTVVFDDHNAEWVLQKTAYETDAQNPRRWHGALYSWVQWHKLARFEREICLTANHVVAVSDVDARQIASLDERIKPFVIPNGVDVEYYVPSEAVCAKPLAELSVVFTGKMDFRPNVDAAVWFSDEILPALRREIPLAHISYVGQKPHARVRALAERPGVEVTGWVEDTRPYIADAAVYAVPLRMGGGTRLKVLEAMAMGKAIVSTKIGISGIECESGRDVVIADSAPDFAHALVVLMRDEARRRELGAHARQLAEDKYDWRKIVPKFKEIYATPPTRPVQFF